MELEPYRRFITERFPQIQVREARFNLEGWDSVVVEVNGELIFRFARRPQVEAGFQKEAALLPFLQRALPVQTPVFEWITPGEEDGGLGCVGYRKISGEPLDARLAAHPAIAGQIGEALTCLHGLALPWTVHRRLPLRSILDWKRHYLDLYQQVRLQVFPRLAAPLQARAAALWEGFLRPRANFRFAMTLIHADLAPEHILCDPQSGRLTGIIDWEDACTGDPALDFAGLLDTGGEAFVHRVLEAYRREMGPNFWARLQFYHQIAPFYRVQYGLETGDDAHLRGGLEELERMLND